MPDLDFDGDMSALGDAVTLESDPDRFLPLAARRTLYVIALAGTAVAPVLAVTHPEYAAAIVAGAGVLNSAALGTALANPRR